VRGQEAINEECRPVRMTGTSLPELPTASLESRSSETFLFSVNISVYSGEVRVSFSSRNFYLSFRSIYHFNKDRNIVCHFKKIIFIIGIDGRLPLG